MFPEKRSLKLLKSYSVSVNWFLFSVGVMGCLCGLLDLSSLCHCSISFLVDPVPLLSLGKHVGSYSAVFVSELSLILKSHGGLCDHFFIVFFCSLSEIFFCCQQPRLATSFARLSSRCLFLYLNMFLLLVLVCLCGMMYLPSFIHVHVFVSCVLSYLFGNCIAHFAKLAELSFLFFRLGFDFFRWSLQPQQSSRLPKFEIDLPAVAKASKGEKSAPAKGASAQTPADKLRLLERDVTLAVL